MAAGCAAASSVVLSSAERRASWARSWVWFLYVFAWFSTETKWLMAVKAQRRAGACFTAHRLLSLINLFTQTEDWNGCRRMQTWILDRGEDEQKASLLARIPIITPPVGGCNITRFGQWSRHVLLGFFFWSKNCHTHEKTCKMKWNKEESRVILRSEHEVLAMTFSFSCLGVCVISLAATEAPRSERCLAVWGLHLR